MELSSKDFYYERPRTFSTIIIVIIVVIVVLLGLYLTIYLFSRIPKTCLTAPPQPTNVEAGYLSSSKFRVQWGRIEDVDNYTVYVGQTQTFTRVQSLRIIESTRNYVDIDGLNLGDTYYIMVSASNRCGESPNSNKIVYLFILV